MPVFKPLAIGARLKSRPGIHTLGFKPNFEDYTADERHLIRTAPRIYYPTAFYADLFNAMGKQTFPSFHTYKFAQDKIRQTAMFRLQKIPHPRTRVFYGPKQKQTILSCFTFPFVAKKPRGSSRGRHVFLIRNQTDLARYLESKSPAYIQEYIPAERDIRIVVIGKTAVLAHWRFSAPDDFRSNVSRGGEIRFDPVPDQALKLALGTAAACGWDDVGIDIMETDTGFQVIEGNMKYGTRGFRQAGIDYSGLLESMIVNGLV